MTAANRVPATFRLADDMASLENRVAEHADPVAGMVLRARPREDGDVRLEPAVTFHAESEGESAELHPVLQWCAGDVLDYVGDAGPDESIACGVNEIGMMGGAVDVVGDRVRLARRTRMDGVEPVEREPHRVGDH